MHVFVVVCEKQRHRWGIKTLNLTGNIAQLQVANICLSCAVKEGKKKMQVLSRHNNKRKSLLSGFISAHSAGIKEASHKCVKQIAAGRP